jgi:dTDP-4-dehydrorhamnose reductase
MKKIYIAGCGGMLGEAFHNVFGEGYALRCTDLDANEPWLATLDFRDLDAYSRDVEAFAPDCLFHLGAHTDLEYCERNQDDAYATNTLAVENATYISGRLGIPLLYISTAGIFDGSKDTFDDWDQPNPMGHYARSKYAGELAVQRSGPRHLICRAGWMMGGGPRKDK